MQAFINGSEVCEGLEIDRAANYAETLEEEQIDVYDTTIKRLKAFTDLEFAKKLEKKIKSSL